MTIDYSSLAYDLSHTDPFDAHDEAKRAYEQANREASDFYPSTVREAIVDEYWVAEGNVVNPDDYYSSRVYKAPYGWERAARERATQDDRYLSAHAEYTRLTEIADNLKQEWRDSRDALDTSDLPVGTLISFRVQTVSEGYSSGSYGYWRNAEYDVESGPIVKITDSNYLVDSASAGKTRRVPRVTPEDGYDRQVSVLWGAEGYRVEQERQAEERRVQDEKNRIAQEAAEAERAARFRTEQAQQDHRDYLATLEGAIHSAKEAALADLIRDMAPVLDRYTRLHLNRLVADLPDRQDAP